MKYWETDLVGDRKYSHTLLHNTIILSVANERTHSIEHVGITKYDEGPKHVQKTAFYFAHINYFLYLCGRKLQRQLTRPLYDVNLERLVARKTTDILIKGVNTLCSWHY